MTRRVQVLIHFAGLASRARSPSEVLPLLAAAAVENVQADAAAILQVGEDGRLRVSASHGLPPQVCDRVLEMDVVGQELGEELRMSCNGRFLGALTLPLAARGGLFGALVLLFAEQAELPDERLSLAAALADLGAIALGQAADYAELEKNYQELRASREALARAEKLRALGQMASGVAHDLKNLLNPLGLYLSLLKRKLGEDSAATETIERMASALQHGNETINLLRDFARQSPASGTAPVDLNVIAREAVALCRPRAASRPVPVSLNAELTDVPPVSGHAPELLSGVVNLIANSIDAMEGAGNVTVRTGTSPEGAFIQVADDGPGMPAEIEAHAFEPFFTTKGEGGSGLGLAMVYALVQRHRGAIRLETAPGAGTAVTLTLPLA